MASLATVPALPIRAVAPRVAIPAGLSDAQAGIWRRTVASVPGGWFSGQHVALLTMFVRHVARGDEIEAALSGIEPLHPDFDRLVRLQGFETARALACARSLRLTLQEKHPTTAGRQAAAHQPRPDVITALFGDRDEA